jgi:L-lactate dehydrogenase complex protein LldG
MKVSSSKEKILKKIREALSNPVPLPFSKSEGSNSVFQPQTEELEILFAEEFTKLSGKFAFCINEDDAKNQISNLIAFRKWKHIFCKEENLIQLLQEKEGISLNSSSLADSDLAITSCDYLVARTGAIVMSSAQPGGRTTSAYTPVHICVAYADQLVYDTYEILKAFKNRNTRDIPSFITFAAGPSRTTGIENTQIIGAHGPKEVYLFLIDKPLQ